MGQPPLDAAAPAPAADAGSAGGEIPPVVDAGSPADAALANDGGSCPITTLVTTDIAAPALGIDDAYVYWIKWRPLNEQGLYRTPKAGGPSSLVTADTENWRNGSTGPVDLTVDEHNVYFTWSGYVDVCCDRDGQIMAVAKTGGPAVALATDLGIDDPNCVYITSPTHRGGHPIRITTDGSRVYWTQSYGNRFCPSAPAAGAVLSVPTMGGPLVHIAGEPGTKIAVDERSAYWVPGGTPGVRKSPKDGSGSVTVLPGVANTTVFAIDASNVYFPDSKGRIYSVAKDGGGNPTLLFAPADHTVVDDIVTDLIVYDGQLYWSSFHSSAYTGHVQAMRTDGSQWRVLNGEHPLRLAADAQSLYWFDDAFIKKSCR